MPSQNLLPFLDLTVDFTVAGGLVLSNHFIPMWGVFPFPLFFTTAFPWEDGTRGMPIITCLHTVAFVRAIFCDKKYSKINLSHILQIVFMFFSILVCSLLLSTLVFRFKPSLSPQMVCCEIISLVIDVSMFQIFKLQCCRF